MNGRNTLISVLTVTMLGIGAAVFAGGDGNRHDRDDEDAKVRLGLKLSPAPLKLRGRNIELVGLGSYLVNTVAAVNATRIPLLCRVRIRSWARPK